MPETEKLISQKHSPLHELLKDNHENINEQLTDALKIIEKNQTHLLDFSLVARCGVKGPEVIHWLKNNNLPASPEINTATETTDNQWLMRLGETEHWVLSNPWKNNPDLPDTSNTSGVYPVYCEDGRAWFSLTGKDKAKIMAKICGVDLRENNFPIGAIVQTSVARVNTVILHHRLNQSNLFSLFFDCSNAEYLWHSLLDAMDEYSQ